MKKELLNNNPCLEKWDEMRNANNGRFCEKCSTSLADLSDKTIEEIANNHYGKNKCVSMTDDQVEFLITIRCLKQISVATSLFLGTVFFNQTYAQVQEKHDSCLVKGVLIDNKKEVVSNRPVLIYIKDNDAVFETKTDNLGRFQINLPKECEIRYSNVKNLVSKKTKNKKVLDVGKVKLPTQRIVPGFL